jgi:hypothetical protein
MPCIIAILAVAFPRVVIVLMWLFTTFFQGVYHGVLIPVLGFLFLPLTLIVYTFTTKTYGHLGTPQLIAIAIALIFDLGLVGSGTASGRSSVRGKL